MPTNEMLEARDELSVQISLEVLKQPSFISRFALQTEALPWTVTSVRSHVSSEVGSGSSSFDARLSSPTEGNLAVIFGSPAGGRLGFEAALLVKS